MADEFATHDTEATLATMVSDAYVNHIPVMTGGVGLDNINTIHRFLLSVDTRDYSMMRTCLTDEINFDYSVFGFSMPDGNLHILDLAQQQANWGSQSHQSLLD